ncbi:hypothetical protein [Novosphingobium soli]|uniref:Uncharacterized protein n=1 Tax=Novosphingobium soli TaxID=574956 RepID=A0ABV6CZV6_9SPHN
MNVFKKTAIAAGLAATAVAGVTPAMARDGYRDNDNTAAVAIGAGILGLAIGAIAASSDDDHDRYYDNRYRGTVGWRNDDYRYQRQPVRGDWRRGYDHDRSDHRRGY